MLCPMSNTLLYLMLFYLHTPSFAHAVLPYQVEQTANTTKTSGSATDALVWLKRCAACQPLS
jgi:hypothetical protein